MRFSVRDVLKTMIISLTWIILLSIPTIIILADVTHALEFSLSIISIIVLSTVILSINKYMLRKNGLSWEALGFRRLNKQQLIKLAWQIPLLWFLMVATQVLFLMIYFGNDMQNLSSPQNGTASLNITIFTFFAALIAIAFVTPIIEEIIFRGGILEALSNKFSVPIAILISSILFVLAHPITLIMPGLIVAGLSLGYLYQKYNSIYAPLLHHMFINTINVLAVSSAALV
ncbi:CPBP family intramembrane metalloprotease [Paenalkalicoccus suaedae]|uniref:CPBP family intramembrane metalloprotease n=1 Tax=Paenalkalicoccus suaedae TaxID=2592382 RepID=A0A859FGP7_9BACI|nr:type II CAAX endopeptidase family protein [Paenalkalicoccus suaedae]QKS72299.1 CPBP family intramembrane metalloprotease [Paenalkalicoccus suaedae]